MTEENKTEETSEEVKEEVKETSEEVKDNPSEPAGSEKEDEEDKSSSINPKTDVEVLERYNDKNILKWIDKHGVNSNKVPDIKTIKSNGESICLMSQDNVSAMILNASTQNTVSKFGLKQIVEMSKCITENLDDAVVCLSNEEDYPVSIEIPHKNQVYIMAPRVESV